MSHIGQFAQMLKVTLSKVQADIQGHFTREGSVLAGTIRAGCAKIEISYHVESADPPDRVAAVLRNARNACYVRQAVAPAVPIFDTMTLNGQPFEIDAQS